jgi:molybdopterin synthase sulfur carrier subunit
VTAEASAGTVTVRYWAAARDAAGRLEDQVAGPTSVQEAIDAVLALRPDDQRFARVVAMSSLLVGERLVRREALDQVSLTEGEVLEVLPPFAGG